MYVINIFVAPYVGAWIETIYNNTAQSDKLSHPTWVRGLKRLMMFNPVVHDVVAPYVGAWIETKQVA